MKLKELIEKYGEYEVKEGFLNQLEKPKPKTIYDLKDGDKYYGITDGGGTFFSIWENSGNNKKHIEIGNVFLMEEEAEFEFERLKVIAKLKKYARPFFDKKNNFFIAYWHENKEIYFDYHEMSQFDILYFNNEEEIKEAIKKVGNGDYVKGLELVKKYYLKVEE